jgi:hypothetical protein
MPVSSAVRYDSGPGRGYGAFRLAANNRVLFRSATLNKTMCGDGREEERREFLIAGLRNGALASNSKVFTSSPALRSRKLIHVLASARDHLSAFSSSEVREKRTIPLSSRSLAYFREAARSSRPVRTVCVIPVPLATCAFARSFAGTATVIFLVDFPIHPLFIEYASARHGVATEHCLASGRIRCANSSFSAFRRKDRRMPYLPPANLKIVPQLQVGSPPAVVVP